MKQTYHELNSELNFYGSGDQIQFDKDHQAAKQYFLEHVNPNTVFFHDHLEKFEYMIENGYYDPLLQDLYTRQEISDLYDFAYSYRFRFPTFVGAYKFYTAYALKTYDGQKYLERYEDRVMIVASWLAQGDVSQAKDFITEMLTGRYQPATPTFLNAGRRDSGEMVSCFLLRIEDNMESIGRSITNALQLSKRGGGVALLLSNIREAGAPIKNVEGQSSGVIPIMKLLEDSFSYANQLGARQGAGAVYLNALHQDIEAFLDTKRENADEKIRIKTLSLGVVIPDVVMEKARTGDDIALFSAYDIDQEYGLAFADVDWSEMYNEVETNPKISRRYIQARKLLQTIAQIQLESGYPYILFEDAANRSNWIDGRITHSNLCVAPETRVLTDKGYLPIGELAGQTINAWNGEKFSPSLVAKTGEDQELVTVTFSNGGSLDVTPYHKFYVKNEYDKPAVEVSAAELVEGDRLEKFELGVIDAPAEDFPRAYTAGLHSAEGTYSKSGSPILRLYPGKLHLGENIEYKSSSLKKDSSGRVSYVLHEDTPRKFHVPTGYSLQSRLEWLAGLIDGDGYGNGVVGIQIASIHASFLEEVRILLTTLGVHSKWSKHKDAGKTQFRESEKFYDTKEIYRLIISGSEAQKLRALGLPTKRVIIEKYEHQRSAREFVKVTGVIATGRIDDTYCLNEPERHKVVFEGIQTGNCSEILQVSTASSFYETGEYDRVGQDISCNLGSLNIARSIETGSLNLTVTKAIDALTAVSELSDIRAVPPIQRANATGHSIGLGAMNLHGFLAKNGVEYGSDVALEFTSVFFETVRFWALFESNRLAIENTVFEGFQDSGYADGSALARYVHHGRSHNEEISSEVLELFGEQVSAIPTRRDWESLQADIMESGLYHRYLMAIPPTGSISYINHSTSSIHPITSEIEIRKEGKLGRVYYPAHGLTNENREFYHDAYELGWKATIDTYAAATPHVDQGLSLTLFFPDSVTTREINRAQIYAWQKGIKTIYYIRVRQAALAGTEIQDCVS